MPPAPEEVEVLTSLDDEEEEPLLVVALPDDEAPPPTPPPVLDDAGPLPLEGSGRVETPGAVEQPTASERTESASEVGSRCCFNMATASLAAAWHGDGNLRCARRGHDPRQLTDVMVIPRLSSRQPQLVSG